ncbi:MAG: dihydropteroate synthase [Paenibacillaceae bacterium]|nr:dihydropteroate synthase [Paenibacillaceae bacterium]
MTTSVLQCRERGLLLGAKTLLMGIVNVTPDSFSDGGRYNTVDKAVAHARQLVADGADIIDIGGESTRPGAAAVSLKEELQRVVPVIEALRDAVDVPLSVDTYKAEVARQALAAGAHIVNDVWGLKADPSIAGVAAQYDCPVIITHNRTDRDYAHFIADVVADLQASIRIAREAGVGETRIVLDPGIGFAKDYEQNLLMLARLDAVVELGYPVLLGTSRKSVIQKTLQGHDVGSYGTAATVALGIARGCAIMRVHDVREMKRVAAMADAIAAATRTRVAAAQAE